jgi:hypothetical protein
MTVRAVHVPNEPVDLVRLDEVQCVVGNPQLRSAWRDDLAGAYVPKLMASLMGKEGKVIRGVSDDNRSALLTDIRHSIGEREFFVSIKGCGAEFDAYTHQRLSAPVLEGICHDQHTRADLALRANGSARFITGERWYGHSPYGAQAPDNALLALLASLRADGDSIAGFHICPLVAAVRLPQEVERMASRFYWYRRYDGAYWQEVRLMPSNLRLYFQSPVTFGMDTEVAFAMFHLTSKGECERFLENLCRSSMAALTLYARTLRHDPWRGGYLGLDLHDVWLDKDAVIAPDGTLHFADLEGVEDVRSADAEQAKERMRWQFFRHMYEVGFALEAMAAQAERFLALGWGRRERRAWLMEAMERASRLDGFARVERRGDGMALIVEPAVDAAELYQEFELYSEVGDG